MTTLLIFSLALAPTGRSAPAYRNIATQAPDTVAQRVAVRELGRREQADLASLITPLISAPAASVRMEAANALGQSAVHTDGNAARAVLAARLGIESDPAVRGVIYRTLGRLPQSPESDPAAMELLMLQGSRSPGGDAPEVTLEGITHGLAALYRRSAARQPPSSAAIERLVQLTESPHHPRVRLQAVMALQTTGRADSGALLDALNDGEWQVRRVAVSIAATQRELPGRERIIGRALLDPSPEVRLDALRGYGRFMMEGEGCLPVLRALQDEDEDVALTAVDLLAGCGPTVAQPLTRLAGTPVTATEWHLPAHAIVSLARIDSGATAELLPELVTNEVWQVRMYAAHAAGLANAVSTLERLARDPHPNVREAAIAELRTRVGHGADALYRDALASNDYQLLQTAAIALDSTPDADRTLPVLLAALERITSQRRETSRDPRTALLRTIGTLGGPAQAQALRPYLTDFDASIAGQAATLLTRWTGQSVLPTPRPLPPPAIPSPGQIAEWERSEAVIEMADGGRMVLRLFPDEAPINTARFVRMAREKWFEGLTFHRVVPNFVVQGGSPGANEYMGDGPFTPDELGFRSNSRGTMGISTRGRHTGDGQIYLNLVDNLRLDHDYTVIGEIVEGLEVLDAILEGDVIRRVTLRSRRMP